MKTIRGKTRDNPRTVGYVHVINQDDGIRLEAFHSKGGGVTTFVMDDKEAYEVYAMLSRHLGFIPRRPKRVNSL